MHPMKFNTLATLKAWMSPSTPPRVAPRSRAVRNASLDQLEPRLLMSVAFAPKTDYATGTSPVAITVADFNADTKMDLAIANSVSGTLSVLLNNGDGTFASKVDYAAGAKPSWISSADLNNDGKIDLV